MGPVRVELPHDEVAADVRIPSCSTILIWLLLHNSMRHSALKGTKWKYRYCQHLVGSLPHTPWRVLALLVARSRRFVLELLEVVELLELVVLLMRTLHQQPPSEEAATLVVAEEAARSSPGPGSGLLE